MTARAALPRHLQEPAAALARPSPVGMSELVEGDSGSAESLERIRLELEQQRLLLQKPMLERALAAMRADRFDEGVKAALQALELEERSGWAWYILAICRERAGAVVDALRCYERALELMPENGELPNDLGRLASRMDMHPVAEKLFGMYLARNPGNADAANNLASALRSQQRYPEAIEVLRTYIGLYPDRPNLWSTLGVVMASEGRVAEGLTFLEEALRLDPTHAKARYNRSSLLMTSGRIREALTECEQALSASPAGPEGALMRLARSQMMLAAGDVGAGWDAYEARLDPEFTEVTNFLMEGPRWTPEEPLAGRSLLVMGEQGLGDEVLFANMVPDLLEEIGPDGRLMLAVEHRLVPLFAQSFPQAQVIRRTAYRVEERIYTTAPEFDAEGFDLWTPMASLLRRYRRSVADFPSTPNFLHADPARVTAWRAALDAIAPGPKVGVLWKSLKIDADRSRYFSPFEQWREVLGTPGVTFINLQYGDCTAELAQARAAGVNIVHPPGIDLKDDLAEVAALSCAVDLVIGPANATSNIAAACGAPVWMISTADAWPRLGTDFYPWYPSLRLFEARSGEWAPVMTEIAAALRASFPRRS